MFVLGHADGDWFIGRHHSEALHAAYSGKKKYFVYFDGDHASERPASYLASVLQFLQESFKAKEAAPTNPDMVRRTEFVLCEYPLEWILKRRVSDVMCGLDCKVRGTEVLRWPQS